MYTNVLYSTVGMHWQKRRAGGGGGGGGGGGVINLRAGVFFWEGESDGQIVM